MKVTELVGRFHGQLILMQTFDNEDVRPRVDTGKEQSPREFAVVGSYLRSLAHVRTLVQLKHESHFQAVAMIARSLFELAVDISLIDRIEDAPAKYAAFSDFVRLGAAQRIVDFHSTHEVDEPLQHLWVYEKFKNDKAAAVDAKAKELWPKQPRPRHWSGMDLRQRAVFLGAPYDEIYDVHYAELSWYTHPGVGVVSALEAKTYRVVCAAGYAVATRCYRQTLLFMIRDLRLVEADPLIEKKMEFARIAAFADDEEHAMKLRRALLGY